MSYAEVPPGSASTMPNRVEIGDCREVLKGIPDASFQACITSPPYWGLRDYGHVDQLGLEATPQEYVGHMVEVFREVRRTLRDDGILWLNLGDTYCKWGGGGANTGKQTVAEDGSVPSWAVRARRDPILGLKPKDLVGIPWRVAFALQADGWWLRSDVIWSKGNLMPESVTDRPSRSHEYCFLLTKSERYSYVQLKEPAVCGDHPRNGTETGGPKAEIAGQKVQSGIVGRRRSPAGNKERKFRGDHGGVEGSTRNARTVWAINTKPFAGSHFAVMPEALVERMVSTVPSGGVILDPFMGSGTVGRVAERFGRRWFGIELNPEYESLIQERTAQIGLGL